MGITRNSRHCDLNSHSCRISCLLNSQSTEPQVRVLRALLAIFVTVAGFEAVLGSSGDRNPSFTECIVSCKASGCTIAYQQQPICSNVCAHSFSAMVGNRPGLLTRLQLLLWDCSTDCDYLCMHAVQAALYQTYGQAITSSVKYHGKWPFLRAWGIVQEPASVFFSIGNLAVHLHGLLWLSRRLTSHKQLTETSERMVQELNRRDMACWLIYSGLHMLAWMASALFHTRDTHLTERLDYCLADVALAWGLLLATTRAAALLLPETPQAAQQTTQRPPTLNRPAFTGVGITLVLGSCLAVQLYYLLFVKFDHEFNVKVGIIAGVAQALLWVVVCRQGKHPGRHWMYCFLALLGVSALLEVGDFPPKKLCVFEVDAHALWHAATFCITPLMYRFVWHDVCRGTTRTHLLKNE